jgi:integrase/recombinase XerD
MSQAKVLTEREIKKVVKVIDSKRHSSRNRCMFLMTHMSGARISEVASLRICDVLAKDGSIKSEVYLSAQQTKGSKGRTLYLSDKLRDEISLYLKTRFKLKDLLPVTMTDTVRALFTNQKDCQRGFSASTACQMFHYWYKEAKIEGASSHSGRRGFITNLANKGVHVRILQELAGHSSIAVTQKYIDVNQDKLRIAVEML